MPPNSARFDSTDSRPVPLEEGRGGLLKIYVLRRHCTRDQYPGLDSVSAARRGFAVIVGIRIERAPVL